MDTSNDKKGNKSTEDSDQPKQEKHKKDNSKNKKEEKLRLETEKNGEYCAEHLNISCECGRLINSGLVQTLKSYFENVKVSGNFPKKKISYEISPSVGELVVFFENLIDISR